MSKEENTKQSKGMLSGAQRYIITGALTVIPLWVTWAIFKLVFSTLSEIGLPWVRRLSIVLSGYSETLGAWILQSWFQYFLAVLITVSALYLLGWAVTRVIGRRVLRLFNSLMDRIPWCKKSTAL